MWGSQKLKVVFCKAWHLGFFQLPGIYWLLSNMNISLPKNVKKTEGLKCNGVWSGQEDLPKPPLNCLTEKEFFICYGLDVCVPAPQYLCWSPNPQCDGRCLGHKGGALVNGISALRRDCWDAPSAFWGHSGTLIPRLQTCRTGSNKFLLFINHSVCELRQGHSEVWKAPTAHPRWPS